MVFKLIIIKNNKFIMYNNLWLDNNIELFYLRILCSHYYVMSYNTGNVLGSFQIINHIYIYSYIDCKDDNQNVMHSGQELVTRFSIIKGSHRDQK